MKKNKIDTKNIFMGSSEAICFLLSGDKGSVYFVNENAKFHRLYQMESGITKLLYSQDKHMLFSITDNLMFGQYSLRTDTEVKNIMTVSIFFFNNFLIKLDIFLVMQIKLTFYLPVFQIWNNSRNLI